MNGKPLKAAAGRLFAGFAAAAARSYVAGEKLEDALRVAQKFEASGQGITLGYFDSPERDSPASVLAAARLALAALKARPCYLSVKLPALAFDETSLLELLSQVDARGGRLHFDAMWPETVDESKKLTERLITRAGSDKLGFTLPGRWSRSLADARWACAQGLKVRVVKGQWADPGNGEVDRREGFVDVVKVLAQHRPPLVAVATHDARLAAECLQILQISGVRAELELLYGLPFRAPVEVAAGCGVPVRIYVPYGTGFLPYAAAAALRNPKIFAWLVKDFFAAAAEKLTRLS